MNLDEAIMVSTISVSYNFYSHIINFLISTKIQIDDTVYRQALMEHRQPVKASLKAGIVVHVVMALVFVSQDPHASAK